MNIQSRVAESQEHAMVSQQLHHTLFNIDATLAMEVNDNVNSRKGLCIIRVELHGMVCMVLQRLSKSRINVE